MMIKSLFKSEPHAPVQPRVTPDPKHAADLERKFSELAYCPENGFHRDRRQQRLPRYVARMLK